MASDSPVIRFGIFEFNLDTNELRRNGMLVKLAAQPAGVLRLLLEAKGKVVTRETIQSAIWPPGIHVDFERGLTVAIGQVRSALNDSADSPRFIQTVPKRGYRFLFPSEPISAPSAPPRRYRMIFAAVAALALAIGAWAAWRISREEPPVIAVLPFRPLDAAVPGVLPEAITEEVINHLGQSGTPLSVLAYGSVSSLSFDDARSKLDADLLVEGAIRTHESGIRITSRLIDRRTAKAVWSKAQELAAANLAGAEETAAAELAIGIAGYLYPGVGPTPVMPATCASGWEQYRTARALLLAPARRDLSKAIEILDQLNTSADGCPAARATLADALFHRGRLRSNLDDLERARGLARTVLDSDPSNAEANNTMAGVLLWKDWDFAGSESHYRRALQRNPSYAAGHHDFAWLLMASGRAGEGVDHLRRAIALDPLSPRVNLDSGWLYLQAHRFQEAARQAERALELDPSLEEARACWARALYYAADYDGAAAQLRQLVPQGLPPAHPDSRAWLHEVYRARLATARTVRMPAPSITPG